MSVFKIGVDLGGTKTEFVCIQDGHVLIRERVATPSHTYLDILDLIVETVSDIAASIDGVATVGVGIPGSLDRSGLVKNANTQCLNGKPLLQDLESRLQLKISLANDANCFALSEYIAYGESVHSMFGVIIGTGVGGGLILHGRPVVGANGLGGEWGHNPLPYWVQGHRQERTCYCGKSNCIETFLSGAGLAETYRQLLNAVNEEEETVVNGKNVVHRLEQGDVVASQALDQYFDDLAASLATVVNVIDPEVIVLGGGLSNLQGIIPAVKKKIMKYVFSPEYEVNILPNKLGDSSGVFGAAWLSERAMKHD